MVVPDVQLINRILAKYETGYQVDPPQLHYHSGDLGPVEFAPDNLSLDEQAQEVIQKSLNQAERLLAQGNGRQAVQEVLWLLETVSTAFQGLQIDTGTIQGRFRENTLTKSLKISGGKSRIQPLNELLTG